MYFLAPQNVSILPSTGLLRSRVCVIILFPPPILFARFLKLCRFVVSNPEVPLIAVKREISGAFPTH